MSAARRMVGWTIFLAWLVIAEELGRLYGPLWAAVFVFVTMLAGLVAVSRGGQDS